MQNKLQYVDRKPIISWFSRESSILVEVEFEDVSFIGGRKTGVPIEIPSEQARNPHRALGWNRNLGYMLPQIKMVQ